MTTTTGRRSTMSTARHTSWSGASIGAVST
jgi:hypothetical protein